MEPEVLIFHLDLKSVPDVSQAPSSLQSSHSGHVDSASAISLSLAW